MVATYIMEKTAITVLTLFLLLPAVLGANIYIKGLKPIATVPTIHFEMKAKPISGNNGTNTVACPGGDVCPVNTTCCMDISGIYEACCPTPFGNCCFDYFSCCPSGYVCNNIDRANNCIKAGGY